MQFSRGSMSLEPERHTCIDWQWPRLCDDPQLKVKDQGRKSNWNQQIATKPGGSLSDAGSYVASPLVPFVSQVKGSPFLS